MMSLANFSSTVLIGFAKVTLRDRSNNLDAILNNTTFVRRRRRFLINIRFVFNKVTYFTRKILI